ncbi:hypothetical protein NX801_09370 [Streptomyces sp. LP05-1]|uniref:DUF732 domain-containing protein n=1 Tax=Streptomyces pyxinae TaxID=2970734 RepID=A0ABT2CEN7_9ACTN|nr:hypothetical protein [Streptomyces sp. LP05-1]MCS0635872.1 hypothetical protein [Streptomyces sp. LP05-1]
MHQRLPLLTACLALAALGASACGPSGDHGPGAPVTPATASAPPSAPVSASASAAPSGGPSAGSADGHKPTGLSAKLYLKTIRGHYPDLDRVSDDALVAHGDALCVARGQALVDQALKTKQELELTGKQVSQILGTAHGYCGENAFG